MADAERINARQVLSALKATYCQPQWAFYEELNIWGMNTRLDAYVVQCWRRKPGYHTITFEIKVARPDFLHELRAPAKRQVAEDCSHQCYFVAPANVIKEEELPEGWGYILCTQGITLRTIRAAKHRVLDALPMWFVPYLARRSCDAAGASEPVIPRAAWKFMGQEIDEAALDKLVTSQYGKQVEVERGEIRRTFLRDYWASADGESARVMFAFLRDHLGVHTWMTPSEVRERLAAVRGGTLTDNLRRGLSQFLNDTDDGLRKLRVLFGMERELEEETE